MSRLLPEGTIRPDQYSKLEEYLSRLPDGNTHLPHGFSPQQYPA